MIDGQEKIDVFLSTEDGSIQNPQKQFKNKSKDNSLLILLLLELFELRNSDFPINHLSRLNQEINDNYYLDFKENIQISFKSIKKLINNSFLLYDEKKIMIYDSFLKNQLFSHTFPKVISYISESKAEIKNKSLIVTLKGGDNYILSIDKKRLTKLEIFIENNIKYTEDINLIIEIVKNKYIFSSNEGTFFYDNNLNKRHLEKVPNEEPNEAFKLGEVINNRYVLLFNNVNSKGIIKYFDLKKKDKIINNLKKFETALILSQNFISLMNIENKNYKILLFSFEKRIGAVKLEFNEDELLINNLYFDFYELNNVNIICLFPIENIYENTINLEKEMFDSHFFMINTTNEKNESEYRIYSLEGFESNKIIQKGYIKSKINQNDFKNKISCISQISPNGFFVISSASEKLIKICGFNGYFEKEENNVKD